LTPCPQCHSAIEISDQHFGTIFTCPMCQAVFFIGWDGQPEAPQMSESSPAPEPQVPIDSPLPPTSEVESSAAVMANPAWDQPLDLGAEAIAPPPVLSVDSSSNFQDVVEFGNSPQMEGPLTYTIFIQGIEIADTREKLREALSDSRLGWDATDLIRKISNGSLMLADLSPAKASVVINRIKYLPIEVTWRQNLLS
jgi:hypothetical protein